MVNFPGHSAVTLGLTVFYWNDYYSDETSAEGQYNTKGCRVETYRHDVQCDSEN